MTERDLMRTAVRWAVRLGDSRPVRVRWSARMRGFAGTADFGLREIALNTRLLAGNRRETVSTLVHEVCHLVAGPSAGHGPRWIGAMLALGFEPEIEHGLDVSHLVQTRRVWIWRCACCGGTLHRTHRGVRPFRCLCGGDFVVVGEAPDRSGPVSRSRKLAPSPRSEPTLRRAARRRRRRGATSRSSR